jgi:ABC-2 type transport system ATP-binding protein
MILMIAIKSVGDGPTEGYFARFIRSRNTNKPRPIREASQLLAIECTDLTKKFGDLAAVDHISFEVEEGEIFGLLGPNGAGKTTTIRMLTTVIPPTEGTAMVGGFDVRKKPDKVRERIGVVLQKIALEWFSPVYDNLDIYGSIYNIPRKERKRKIEWLLKEFGLEEKRNEVIELLSGGLQKRVQVARAFMHHPEILFLDEPTLGLDPQSRRKTWDFIKDSSKTGQTIVLSTNYMDEAEYLSDRIGIIDHGRIIALDTLEALKDSIGGGDIIDMNVEGDIGSLRRDISELDYVKTVGGTSNLSVQVSNADETLIELSQCIIQKGGRIRNVVVRKPTLEDIFIKLTGRAIRE